MAARFAPVLDQAAQKWRGLAERRRAHFIELFSSGRWKHYYGERQFLELLRDAVRASAQWAEIASPRLADVGRRSDQPKIESRSD